MRGMRAVAPGALGGPFASWCGWGRGRMPVVAMTAMIPSVDARSATSQRHQGGRGHRVSASPSAPGARRSRSARPDAGPQRPNVNMASTTQMSGAASCTHTCAVERGCIDLPLCRLAASGVCRARGLPGRCGQAVAVGARRGPGGDRGAGGSGARSGGALGPACCHADGYPSPHACSRQSCGKKSQVACRCGRNQGYHLRCLWL